MAAPLLMAADDESNWFPSKFEARVRRNYYVLPRRYKDAIRSGDEASWVRAVAAALRVARGDPSNLNISAAACALNNMCDNGYSIRGGMYESEILEALYALALDPSLQRCNPMLHQMICIVFRRCIAVSEEGWHLQAHDRRNPVLDWKRLTTFLDQSLLLRGSAIMNKRQQQFLSDTMGDVRKLILEARLLFAADAFADVWDHVKRTFEICDAEFWPHAGLLLPTSRLFSAGLDAAAAQRQCAAVDEVLRSALATSHWHSSAGSVRFAILRLVRRLWVAYLAATPESFPLFDRLHALFDRKIYVKELFHIAFWTLRVPIGDPDEVGSATNVGDSALYFGGKGQSLRSEVADTLVATLVDDTTDVFWENFNQLCRVVEVHATAVSTRRSQYGLSFLASFATLLVRRVVSSSLPHRRLAPHATLHAGTLCKVAEKLLPFAESTLFGEASQSYSLSIFAACAFLRPHVATARTVLNLAELGLQANEESHQVGAAARLLAATASHLIYEKVLRSKTIPRGCDGGGAEPGARAEMVATSSRIIVLLTRATDPNDITKLEPCVSAAARMLLALGAVEGAVAELSPQVLSDLMAKFFEVLRTGALRSSVQKMGSGRGSDQLRGHLASIFACIVSVIVTREQVSAIADILTAELLNVTEEHFELLRSAARGIGLVLDNSAKTTLLGKLLDAAAAGAPQGTSVDGGLNQRRCVVACELLKTGPPSLCLSLHHKVTQLADSFLAASRGAEGDAGLPSSTAAARGDLKLRKTRIQTAGKLIRAQAFGLTNDSGFALLPASASLESCFQSKSTVQVDATAPSEEAFAAAQNMTRKYFDEAYADVQDFHATFVGTASASPSGAGAGDGAASPAIEARLPRLLSSLLVLRYVCSTSGFALLWGSGEPVAPFDVEAAQRPWRNAHAAPWWIPALSAPQPSVIGKLQVSNVADVLRTLQEVFERVVQTSMSDASTLLAKTLRVGMKTVAVIITVKSSTLAGLWRTLDAIITFTGNVSSDQLHYPSLYFSTLARKNVCFRRTGVMLANAHINEPYHAFLSRLSLCRLRNLRSIAQQFQDINQRPLVALIGVDAFVENSIHIAMLRDRAVIEKSSDEVVAGLQHSIANQVSAVLWQPSAKLREAIIDMAVAMLIAKEFTKPSNEDRRAKFFSDLSGWLRRCENPEDMLASLVARVEGTLSDSASVGSISVITLTRYFSAVEALTPDAASPALTSSKEAIITALRRVLPTACEVAGTRTRANEAMLQLLAPCVAKRHRVYRKIDRRRDVAAPATFVDPDSGAIYVAAQTNNRPGRVFETEEKLLLRGAAEADDDSTACNLTPWHLACGDLMLETVRDAATGAPSEWLKAFLVERCVTGVGQHLPGGVVLAVKLIVQVASQSRSLLGRRVVVAHVMLDVAEHLMILARDGAQDQEQYQRGAIAAAVCAGAWRACKTLRPETPERERLLQRILVLFQMSIRDANLSNAVADFFADALPHMAKYLLPQEMSRITVFFVAELQRVADDDGQSQLVVRVLQFVSALCVLGMSREQYMPLLECITGLARYSVSGNHQVRKAAVQLLYGYFCITAFFLPEWLWRRTLPASSVLDNVEDSERVRALREAAVAEILPQRGDDADSPSDALEPGLSAADAAALADRRIIAGKTFLGCVMGSQDFVAFQREGAVVQGIMSVASFEFPDGDSVLQLLLDCANKVSFQLHPKRGVEDIIASCNDALRSTRAHRRAKLIAAKILRITLYQNQLQFVESERIATVTTAMDALRGNFDSAHRPLRVEIRLTFSVLCRLLPQTDVASLAQHYIKTGVDAVSGRLNASVVLAAAFVADSFPEAVPKFMPKLLCKLARWAALPIAAHGSAASHADVTTTIREVLNKWWRVHRDLWHFKHKECFSEAQQELLMDHFLSHSYYV